MSLPPLVIMPNYLDLKYIQKFDQIHDLSFPASVFLVLKYDFDSDYEPGHGWTIAICGTCVTCSGSTFLTPMCDDWMECFEHIPALVSECDFSLETFFSWQILVLSASGANPPPYLQGWYPMTEFHHLIVDPLYADPEEHTVKEALDYLEYLHDEAEYWIPTVYVRPLSPKPLFPLDIHSCYSCSLGYPCQDWLDSCSIHPPGFSQWEYACYLLQVVNDPTRVYFSPIPSQQLEDADLSDWLSYPRKLTKTE
jgi:hypothetical protein